MRLQVIEISSTQRHLSLDRGFLLVSEKQKELARLPLDDIGSILISTPGCSLSTNIAVELATRGIPLVICGSNFRPSAILWPVEQHHEQAGRFKSQISVDTAIKNKIWQQLIRQKILNQFEVLRLNHQTLLALLRLSKDIKPGDPTNLEAQAARYYWRALFGNSFRRDLEGSGVNAKLNYGYAILRAAVARAVSAAGLHPSFGIFHKDPKNTFQLVDDLMEPFRPLIDHQVIGTHDDPDLSVQTKKILVSTLQSKCIWRGETFALSDVLHRFASSYAAAISRKTTRLHFPDLFSKDTNDTSAC